MDRLKFLSGPFSEFGDRDDRIIELDATQMLDRKSFFAEISTRCKFPEYFSGNLDSMEECLLDTLFYERGDKDVTLVVSNSSVGWCKNGLMFGILIQVFLTAVDLGALGSLVFADM